MMMKICNKKSILSFDKLRFTFTKGINLLSCNYSFSWNREKIKTMSAFDSISVDDILLTKLDRYVSDSFFCVTCHLL